MDPVRIGMIGVGQISKIHLKRYAEIEGADIVAAADIDSSELARVAETYKIPDTYTDFREMLARDDIRAVDVCLHNNLHRPATVAALSAGKHVYCEKPIAGSYADGVAMVEAAKDCGKMLHIQLFSLFTKETKVARRLIADGHLGKLYHGRSTGYRRRGRPFVDGYGTKSFVKKETAAGGALLDMGIYHIAQMLHILGTPKVERISGRIYQETEMDPGRRDESGYDVEELALGFVKCEGGVTLDIVESWAVHLDPFAGSYVLGSKGGIRLNPFSYHANLSDVPMNATFEIDGADSRWHSLDENESANDSSQHHWIAALQGRAELVPSAEVALRTMLVSEGIYLSDRLGREVSADEVEAESKSTAVKL